MFRGVATLTLAVGVMLTAACSQSDSGITTSVKSRLAADDTVKAYQIDVDTADRVVTLRGTVDNPAAKQQAVTIARQTNGVRDVVDQITVGAETAATTGDLREGAREAGRKAREEAREGTDATKDAARDARGTAGGAVDRTKSATADAGITAAVKSKFLADSAVIGLKLDVDTENGVVTLKGTAATRAEADRAVELARKTEGVKRVVNNIRVEG